MSKRSFNKNGQKKKSFLSRALKWTGISVLIVLVVLILVPFLFKDKIMLFIKDQANESLNAHVDFGDVNLTLISSFPDFHLEIHDVKVIGIEEFKDVVLAEIGKTEVALDLWSVIGGEHYEIHKIGLTDPTLNVHVLEDGTANYLHILKEDTTQVEEDDILIEEEETVPFRLALKKYFIRNANIIYDDQPMNMYVGLHKFTHEGKGDLSADQVDFETYTSSATVDVAYDGVKYIKKAEIDVIANLAMDMEKMRFEFRENRARLNDLEVRFDGFMEMAEDYYDMDLSFGTNNPDFKSLLSMVPAVYLTGFEDVKTDGTFGFKGAIKGKYTENSYPAFNLDLEVGNASFWYPDMPAKVSNIQVVAHVNRKEGPDFDNTNIDVKKFHLELADNPVDVTLQLSTPISDPNINCTVDARVDLEKLKTVIPMTKGEKYNGVITSDIAVKGRMSAFENEDFENFKASGQLGISKMKYTSPELGYQTAIDSMLFIFTPYQLDLANLDAKIGESDVQASGKIDNYLSYYLKEETIKGEFKVTSTKFDLNELMSTYYEDTITTAGYEDTNIAIDENGSGEDSEPYEIIQIPGNIDFLLHSRFKEVLYDSMRFENISGDIVVKESVADLKDLKMDAMGGSMKVNGTYSTKNPEVPRVEFTYNISNMDIKTASENFVTMEKLVPIAKKCQGKFSTDMTFNADLDHEMYPIYSSLNGKGFLKSSKVYIEDVNWMKKLSKALQMPKLAKQDIKDLNVPFEFHDGRIFVSELDVNLGKTIPTSIAGNMTFEQTMDYVMTMKVPRREFGSQANEALEGLLKKAASKGINTNLVDHIPVKVKIAGPVDNPKITTDFNNSGKEALTDIVDNAKEVIKDTITKIVTQKVQEAKDDANEKLQEKKKEIIDKAKKIAAETKAKCEELSLQAKQTAHKVADDLVTKEKNPAKKLLAKQGAKIAKQQADKKYNQALEQCQKKHDDIIKKGESEAEKVKIQ